MLPPYGPEEVARAIELRLLEAGLACASLTVMADDGARTWRVEARLPEVPQMTPAATFPFASAEGIHTPAELAEWFVAGIALP